MIEDREQTMELCVSLLKTRKHDQIDKYFTLENNIQTINRTGPDGNITLHVASCYGYNEVVQLLFTNTALESFENNSQSKMDEIKTLFLQNSTLHDSQKQSPDYDYIDWSANGNDLIQKAKEFRAQIDLYKTYDNQHHFITKLLVEIIDYYLNEYLVQQEHFPIVEKQKIENIFKEAIEEQNYLKHFIKAYTFTNNFHRVLNKHLSLYILHYFDPPSYPSLQPKYRLINCLAHIVTLLINHPDIHKYRYKGITYRGLLMNENDLKCYSIDNYILNRSFVSTSKNRAVAEIFADIKQENISGGTSHHHDLRERPVLLRYTIKQNQTGIDIGYMSTVPDEEEVLILPFSVFLIKSRTEICSSMSSSSSMVIEIDLEECEDKEQIINETQKSTSRTSLRHQTKERKHPIKPKCYISIGLCIMLSLIVAVDSMIRSERAFENGDSTRKLGTIWKGNGTTMAGGNDEGNNLNQLNRPSGISIDDNQTIYVADSLNYRIVEWKSNATIGRIVAGRNGDGNQMDQLNYPTDVVIDKDDNSLITCDGENRRVMRWSRQNHTHGQVIIPNITCWGLTMDKNGSLYASDYKKNEVKRWRGGEKDGTIVAGGKGEGKQFNQLKYPTFIFVDDDQSLYVSDQDNHRVMKWLRNAKEGTVVAGGKGEGNKLTQLSSPKGITVDQFSQIYVADYYNNRVIRWCQGATEGTVVVGGNGDGKQSNQFSYPMGLSFDREGNLYVVDKGNARIQKFEVDTN